MLYIYIYIYIKREEGERKERIKKFFMFLFELISNSFKKKR